MKALWWSCVQGLLCMSAYQAMANTVTAAQVPSSISEVPSNSSVSIRCSITSIYAMGLSFNRRFDTQDIIYLSLKEGKIAKNTTANRFKGRIEAREEHRKGTGLNITITLSWLQVDDTDLYYCRWKYFNEYLETYSTNGSIIVVKEYPPERDQPQCEDDILDILSTALSIASIPFVLCLLIFSAFALCKHFTKKFTPSRSAVSPPPRRPQRACPPPPYQTYSYLSTSVSPGFRQEYLH